MKKFLNLFLVLLLLSDFLKVNASKIFKIKEFYSGYNTAEPYDHSSLTNEQFARALERGGDLYGQDIRALDLSGCSNLTSLVGISTLINLESLELSGSGVINLELFGLDNLTYLGISKCRGIRDLSNLSRLVKLEDLDASDCIGINDVSVLSELYNLITVNLAGCTGIYVLPVLSGLTKLVFLGLSGCTGLRDVSTLLGLPNVNILNLSECTGLIALPDFRLCDSLVLLNLRGTRFIEGLDAYLIERATLDRTHESVAALMDAICVRKRASDFGGFVNDVRFSGLT
jgi:hypothetical protein